MTLYPEPATQPHPGQGHAIRTRLKPSVRRPATIAVLGLACLFLAAGCSSIAGSDGWARPVVDGQTIYISVENGKMASLDAVSFQQNWIFPPDTEEGKKLELKGIYSAPIVAGGLVYFGGYDGNVYAMNAGDGSLKWGFATDGPIIGGIQPSAGATPDTLYVGSDGGTLYALNAETGDIRWRFAAGDAIWTRPLLLGDTLYVGTVGSKLFTIDTKDGTQKGSAFSGNGGFLTDPTPLGTSAVLVGGIGKKLYSVDVSDPSKNWSFKTGNWIWGQPLVDSNKIYLADLDGNVYALDKDGKPLWTQPYHALAGVRAAPVLAGGVLIIVDRQGNVYGLDPAQGRMKWTGPAVLNKTVLADPLPQGAQVLIVAQGGDLFQIDPVTGSPTTVLRPK